MEAKNLRIGNLILFPTQADNGLLIPSVVRKVDAIGFGNVISLNPPTYPTNFDAYIKNCMGIELTAEWLYKFGFIRNGMECNIPLPLGTGLDLSIEDDGETCIVRRHFCDGVLTSDFDYAYVKHCKYVHELQNLFFALTGTELELKTESSTCG